MRVNKTIVTMLFLTNLMSGCNNDVKAVDNQEEQTVQMAAVKNEHKINIQIGDRTFSAILDDNPSTDELMNRLPLDITMQELNGNEKYYRFNERFPSNDYSPKMIHTGDIMLYNSSYFVLFYKDFSTSYSYTRLGQIENSDGLAEALGSDNVRIAISK